ncbi:hypothetical protein OF117_00755 [Geodermatophilus sp. YIM 151500]|uniref:Acg family FMN-binding oxidoreductase n=1 Tax=Geodermatophilus sp. YIM 151500 TaxID=2984531 RepID=UPI0021E40651|nr:hypothetical protein [Geodermatophilus sp. YIM 151500]MCV2487876.1 hypothetical protein [Geodermatophilus sp. YIM 151500]
MSPATSPAHSDEMRTHALEHSIDRALLAPSVHNTQPWIVELARDSVALRADRSRQLTVIDPHGRELLISGGAALLNLRAALADRNWAIQVDRLPDPDDPDLLAVVRPVEGSADGELAVLAPAIDRRRTNRRRFCSDPVPDEVVDRLSRVAAAEDADLVPVVREEDRRLVARLTQQADEAQNADPAYRAEIRRWTNRSPEDRDGVQAAAVPHVDGSAHDDLPLRDFDSAGAGMLPPDTHSTSDQTLLLLATRTDDPLAWLRTGEAMERLLLELTRLDWAASPITQAVEVPLTRSQLRSALTWGAHPQVLLRIGRAAATTPSPRRRRDDMVTGSTRPPEPMTRHVRPSPVGWPPSSRERNEPRPVPDGRGGTVWI